MVDVLPFPCIRPNKQYAREVAALPYDVMNREEAKEEIRRNPYSFLRIDKAEATLPDNVDPHCDQVYDRARTLLDHAIADGLFVTDGHPYFYLYRLTTPEGHCQTGVVGCASIDDYTRGAIKKHENTRADKEIDRIRHVDTCSAQTGPIYLAYKSDGTIEQVSEKITRTDSLYDFTADDGVQHTVWQVTREEDVATIQKTFANTDALYIADGHHRTASAVKAGLMRRESAQKAGCEKAQLASDHFLSVIFPSNQLTILDYNRVVSDLHGLTAEEYLEAVRGRFIVSPPQDEPVRPEEKGTFGMYLGGAWYELKLKQDYQTNDPVAGLDVALLQDNLLSPILGIEDPRTDARIDFVGGIRGLEELERRVAADMTVAFALYPTAIDELFAVADAGKLMPPKSTWFEPKLRSGLFIHRI